MEKSIATAMGFFFISSGFRPSAVVRSVRSNSCFAAVAVLRFSEFDGLKQSFNGRANRTANVDAGWRRKDDSHFGLESPDGGCRSGFGG